MPMSKDPQGGGSNVDGTKNKLYCSFCYENGEFSFQGNVRDFQEFCRKMMKESGMNGFTAWLFSRGMKRLPRWKNQ
jgi:hypothetical protein